MYFRKHWCKWHEMSCLSSGWAGLSPTGTWAGKSEGYPAGSEVCSVMGLASGDMSLLNWYTVCHDWIVCSMDGQASHILGHGPVRARATHQQGGMPNGSQTGNYFSSIMRRANEALLAARHELAGHKDRMPEVLCLNIKCNIFESMHHKPGLWY